MKALLSFKLAYQHIRSGFGRVVLSIVVIALGVALVVAVQLMNLAVLDSFLDTIDGVAGRAALTVTAGEGVTFDEALVEKLAAVPGVTLAVPLVTGVAFPDDGSGELLTVHGVDVANDAAVRVYHSADTSDVVDDLAIFLNSKDSIILGREFADRRGLTVGSKLDLVTSTGLKQFIIRGLLDPEGLAHALRGRLIVMDLYAAEVAFAARGQINQIDLLVERGREDQVKNAIAAALPPGLRVEEPALRKNVIRKSVSGFQAMLTAFALLAVLAGFVICYSRLAAIFEARTWEVGLLRAVGLPRWVVFTELLKESLLIGVAGSVVGVPLGIIISRLGLQVMATATALQFRLPVSVVDPVLSARALLIGAAVGLVSSVLAAAIPALRLARKQPVAALTMGRRDLPLGATSVRWGIGIAVLVVIGSMIWLHRISGNPALGNLTTMLIALASCVAAGPLVRTGSRVLGRVWYRLFGVTGRLAARHLGERSQRTSLTVATLGVGLGAVLMFGVLATSLEQTIVSRFTARIQSDLVVTSAFVSAGWFNAPMAEAVVAEIRKVPGVAVAVAQEEKDVLYQGAPVVLDAWDSECFVDVRACRWPLDRGGLPDALARVARGEAVLVSSSFAHEHKTRPGDLIRLDSPNGPLAFPVVAVTPGQVLNAVVMNRDLYRRATNDPLVTWIYVTTDGSRARAAIENEIARTLGVQHRIQIRSSVELIDYFAGQAREAFKALYVMEAIIFLLVLFATGDTLAAGVIERYREFGMVRAVGLRRVDLFRVVLFEGAGIGVLGLLLASGLGVALGTFWVELQFPAILGWVLEFHIPFLFALAAAGLTLILCIAGSLLPSMRAAYLPVAAALRTE